MKTLLGLVLLVVIGFIVFVTLSALGLMIALIRAAYAWWQIVLGTILGMIIVLVHILDEEKLK